MVPFCSFVVQNWTERNLLKPSEIFGIKYDKI